MYREYQIEAIQIKNELYEGNQEICDLIILGYSIHLQEGYFPTKLISKSSLDSLLFYVEQSHKYYLLNKLPQISQSIRNLAKLIGDSHPSILVLDYFYHQYYRHLADHIYLEDESVFPYIRTLVEIQEGENDKLSLLRAFDRNKLKNFCEEHSDTEIDIRRVRRAIVDFTPPKHGESQYRLLVDQLKSLETDLNFHNKLEEEILVPKAIELENVIRA